MPFIERIILPNFVSRQPAVWGYEVNGNEIEFVGEYDLIAVANVSLCSILRQLSALAVVADQIYEAVDTGLNEVAEKSKNLINRVQHVQNVISNFDPKTVPVPVGCIKNFSEVCDHYKSEHPSSENLFTPASRPPENEILFNQALSQSLKKGRNSDERRQSFLQNSKNSLLQGELSRYYPTGERNEENVCAASLHVRCDPVIGDSLKTKKLCQLLDIETRRPASFVALREWCSDEEVVEFELSPVAPTSPVRSPAPSNPSQYKLPLPEQRQLAISSRFPPQFVNIDVSGQRFRRMELFRQSLVKYDYVKNRKQRKKTRRRNTICDAREARALKPLTNFCNYSSKSDSTSSRGYLLSTTEPSFESTSSTTKTSSDRGASFRLKNDSSSQHSTNVINYRNVLKDRFTNRKENSRKADATRSSSGNWSGTSSLQTSIDSDTQTHCQPFVIESTNKPAKPKSEPLAHSFIDSEKQVSYSPSNTESISCAFEEFSSSCASDDTITPTQDINDIPFADNDDSCSVFSCDTEGYYTSFHIDSGLRSVSTDKITTETDVAEIFARENTGTTNSLASLGTIIMRNPDKKNPPKPPVRVSSLDNKRDSVVTVVHVNGSTSSTEDVAGSEENSCDDSSNNASKECDIEERSKPSSYTISQRPNKVDSLPRKDCDTEKFDAIPISKDETNKGNSQTISSISRTSNEKRLQQRPLPPPPDKKSNEFDAMSERQPGDGAVAPALPSTSPSFQVPTSDISTAPNLKRMSQSRSNDQNVSNKIFHSQEPQVVNRTQNDFHQLGKSVSERRAEIQKVFENKKVAENASSKSHSTPTDAQNHKQNIVSSKELSVTNSSTHPFTSVKSLSSKVVKSNEIAQNSKTLTTKVVKVDSQGTPIDTSESLQRTKGHTSFEPGPYVRPPPITVASSTSQSKARFPHASSIQNTPLPPVPGQKTPESQYSKNSANTNIDSSPNLNTHGRTSLENLSGLSAHMQPRTMKEVKSLRSRSPNPVGQEKTTESALTSGSKNSNKPAQQKSLKDDELKKYDDQNIVIKEDFVDNMTPQQKMRSKQLLLQQQNIELQKQLEYQQMELQKHKARQAEQQKKGTPTNNLDHNNSTTSVQQLNQSAQMYGQITRPVAKNLQSCLPSEALSGMPPNIRLPNNYSMYAGYNQPNPGQTNSSIINQVTSAQNTNPEINAHRRFVPNTSMSSQTGFNYGYQSLPRPSSAKISVNSKSISVSPPPYSQQNNTNSDIYGRIGMTRQVQVGGTLPAGFTRNQIHYSSLPPNLRQSQDEGTNVTNVRRNKNYASKSLTRRASVAGTEANKLKIAVSNPSTPEKALEKKERLSKKEEKKKNEAKSDKTPKKKLFWTLPLRRKKKNQEEEEDDDDGGFKDATLKSGVRRGTKADEASFIHYPSPDTASSDLNTSHSSDGSTELSYRSSPSSEVYYYTHKARTESNQASPLILQNMSITPGATSTPKSMLIHVPKSHGITPTPPSNSHVMLAVDNSTDVIDLTANRRFMSRDEMYTAMQHPEYYNNNNASLSATNFVRDLGQSNSNRSSSPAVFGVNPIPPEAVRPQVKQNVLVDSAPSSEKTDFYNELTQNDRYFESYNRVDISAVGYRETLDSNICELQESGFYNQSSNQSLNKSNSTKQTTLLDFKKMILDKSMKARSGKVSAVELLKASRPGIYGYYLPPTPEVLKSERTTALPVGKEAEGVIIPPNSRNTARALLFQSRFGSGRRYRSPKTEIISTTIVENKVEEELMSQQSESEEESEESDGTTVSKQSETSSLRAHKSNSKSEEKLKSCEIEKLKDLNESLSGAKYCSTPNKPIITPLTVPSDVSIILTYSEEGEVENQSENLSANVDKSLKNSL